MKRDLPNNTADTSLNKKPQDSTKTGSHDDPLNSPDFIKIGQASKSLGISIDTLRRWERSGKLTSIRTPGGTRLYSQELLEQLKDQFLKKKVQKPPTVNELIPTVTRESSISDFSSNSPEIYANNNNNNKIYAYSGAFIIFTLIITSVAVLGYKSLGNLFTSEKIDEKTKTVQLTSDDYQAVLAVTQGTRFLEINTDAQVNGALFVRDAINELIVESTPSASTFALSSGDTSLDVTNSSTIDQNLSTSSSPTFVSPTFTSANLSGTSNQLIFQSGGPTGTLTWTPTAARTITLPNATGEISLLGQKISNSELDNSSITIDAGTNLGGGGSVSLGGSVTLNLDDSISLSGSLTVSGTTKFNGVTYTWPSADGSSSQTLSTNGSGTLSWSTTTSPGWTDDGTVVRLTTSTDNVGIGTSAPGAKLSIAGNLGVGVSFANAVIPVNGLAVQGNVGIGTTSPAYEFEVIGNVGISRSLVVGSALQLQIYDCSGLNNSGKLTADSSGRIVCADDAGASSSITGSGSAGQITFWTSGTTISGNNALYWNNNNFRLGIGTTAPGTDLSVVGSVGIGVSFANASIPTNGLAVQGNVGIGTTSPDYPLHIIGNVGIGTSLTVTSLINTTALAVTGTSSLGTAYAGTLTTSGNAGIGGSLTITSLTYSTGGLRVNGFSDLTGNVGIGQSLSVSSTGAFRLAGQNCSGLNNLGKLTTDSSGNVYCASDIGSASSVDGTGATNQVAFFTDTDTLSGNNAFYWNNGLMRLGIGSSAPGSTLGVFGSVGIGSSYAGATLPTSARDGLVVQGNVGVGTSNPQFALDVVGNVGISSSLTATSNINTASLSVSGTSSLGSGYASTLTVSGNVGVGQSLTVTSAASFSTLGEGIVQSNSLGGLSSGPVNLGSATFV
ncbi:MAG: helix-turn-helix domain-containing protein, partial [Candidatus Daviesbacteria bacterium]|nr:helix-turn-helix domain-containing protein [Candidatus Daviesbacteria bacterium]